MTDKRFELYVSVEEDMVAIRDKLTGIKYHTLEDIIDLVNDCADDDYYYNRILNHIEIYKARIENNRGIVISGDIYNAKLSVLNELLKE